MDARTRERLPALPVLVRAVDQWRRHSSALLTAARAVMPGQPLSVAEETLVRSVRPHVAEANAWADDSRTGTRRCLSREEDHAFWAWAIIEVLRLTGVRVEELLEISHYSLVQYHLPTTGELVPLLQIVPSKTDTERLIVVRPELAEVLSSVISRIRDETGGVPLVRARCRRERIWLPARHCSSSAGTVLNTTPSAVPPSAISSPRRSPTPVSSMVAACLFATRLTTFGGCSSPMPSEAAYLPTSPSSWPGIRTSM